MDKLWWSKKLAWGWTSDLVLFFLKEIRPNLYFAEQVTFRYKTEEWNLLLGDGKEFRMKNTNSWTGFDILKTGSCFPRIHRYYSHTLLWIITYLKPFTCNRNKLHLWLKPNRKYALFSKCVYTYLKSICLALSNNYSRYFMYLEACYIFLLKNIQRLKTKSN